jgi:hypothetical protein
VTVGLVVIGKVITLEYGKEMHDLAVVKMP